MGTTKRVSKYLKTKRIEANLSQGDLAKKLKLHPQMISNWERGVCGPPDRHLLKLCGLLKINKSEFIDILLTEFKIHYKKLLHQKDRS